MNDEHATKISKLLKEKENINNITEEKITYNDNLKGEFKKKLGSEKLKIKNSYSESLLEIEKTEKNK